MCLDRAASFYFKPVVEAVVLTSLEGPTAVVVLHQVRGKQPDLAIVRGNRQLHRALPAQSQTHRRNPGSAHTARDRRQPHTSQGQLGKHVATCCMVLHGWTQSLLLHRAFCAPVLWAATVNCAGMKCPIDTKLCL